MLEINELIPKSSVQTSPITFHVNDGSFCGIFGPDDSGKTELINVIAGISPAKSGTVLFQGYPIQKLPADLKKQIRYVPDTVFMDFISGEEYLRMIRRHYHIEDICEQIELLDYFHIEAADLAEPMNQMTYESNKVICLIGALITNPELLILDEPGNFLTDETYTRFLHYLTQRHEKQAFSLLITSDSHHHLYDSCLKLLYLKDGAVLFNDVISSMDQSLRILTAFGSNCQALMPYMSAHPIPQRNRCIYLYKPTQFKVSLPAILKKAGITDFLLEAPTLEELIEENFSRWEG